MFFHPDSSILISLPRCEDTAADQERPNGGVGRGAGGGLEAVGLPCPLREHHHPSTSVCAATRSSLYYFLGVYGGLIMEAGLSKSLATIP